MLGFCVWEPTVVFCPSRQLLEKACGLYTNIYSAVTRNRHTLGGQKGSWADGTAFLRVPPRCGWWMVTPPLREGPAPPVSRGFRSGGTQLDSTSLVKWSSCELIHTSLSPGSWRACRVVDRGAPPTLSPSSCIFSFQKEHELCLV